MWIGLNSDHDAIWKWFGLLIILNNDDAFEYYWKFFFTVFSVDLKSTSLSSIRWIIVISTFVIDSTKLFLYDNVLKVGFL